MTASAAGRMQIVVLGGGPGGLYFSILMKKAHPECVLRVIERNRADDTFGWGVVFSDETLSNFEEADPESYRRISGSFATWTDIDTFVGGQRIVSTGHAFCGLSRKRLLSILQERAAELGVGLEFQKDITRVEDIPAADLLVAADGVNSLIRTARAAEFGPGIAWGNARFCWLGTTRPLSAFTFVFRENEHGLFQVHAYPFEQGLSTWIVETHEDTWRRAGLDTASEEQTVAYCQRLFAPDLDGHPLLTNRSLWRQFPTVTNERWRSGTTVLIGDAAHTAHFSVGSGTKLAMEDAIALAAAFGPGRLPDARPQIESVLAAFEDARRTDVVRLQRAALTSREWFENSRRYWSLDPLQFTFSLMTRSKRITWSNLTLRDPALMARVDEDFHVRAGAPLDPSGAVPPPAFTPFALRGLTLANRIVVSPMCQYSAVDGMPGDWHLVHLGSRALGGPALVIAEMTDVLPDGRITTGCTGLWSEAHAGAWARIVKFIHQRSGAAAGIQLAHAGRKGSTKHPWGDDDTPLPQSEGGWETIAPSSIPFAPGWPPPRAMTRADMDTVRDAFVRSARLAHSAGFDLIELHMAHGYLLSSFLCPLSNRRDDEYGGSIENRMRFPLEVLRAVRSAWPLEKPISVRISASDWMPDDTGTTPEEAVVIAGALAAAGCDLVDVSSAGNVPDSPVIYGRMYQVPFAEKIRFEAGVPVMAVGGIQGVDHANTIVAAGRADLCAIARAHLTDPYLAIRAAAEAGLEKPGWPGQYLLGRPRARVAAPPAPVPAARNPAER